MEESTPGLRVSRQRFLFVQRGVSFIPGTLTNALLVRGFWSAMFSSPSCPHHLKEGFSPKIESGQKAATGRGEKVCVCA